MADAASELNRIGMEKLQRDMVRDGEAKYFPLPTDPPDAWIEAMARAICEKNCRDPDDPTVFNKPVWTAGAKTDAEAAYTALRNAMMENG